MASSAPWISFRVVGQQPETHLETGTEKGDRAICRKLTFEVDQKTRGHAVIVGIYRAMVRASHSHNLSIARAVSESCRWPAGRLVRRMSRIGIISGACPGQRTARACSSADAQSQAARCFMSIWKGVPTSSGNKGSFPAARGRGVSLPLTAAILRW
jgi:hypothetical protein